MTDALAFFADYRAIIFEFLLELYVFYFLFAFRLKRRRRYYLRFAVGFALVCAVALPVTFFYRAFGGTVWGRTINYIFLFLLSVAHVYLCCRESVWTVVFCCVAAYAAQNLAYKIFLLVWYLGEGAGVFPGLFQVVHGNIFYYIYYYAFFAVIVTAIYFLFAKKVAAHLTAQPLNYKILAISVVILCITVVLCTIEDLYYTSQPMLLRQTSNVFSIICCVCVLLLLSGILAKNTLESEVQLLQQAMHQREQQYNISKDTIDLINVKCHDMRHRVDALRRQGGGTSPQDLDELEEAISIYDSDIKTGNDALDIILTEKSLYCEKMGIRFSCMADGASLSFIGETDIYCLFGNIVDNSIEAVSKLADEELRIIDLTVRRKEDLLLIQIENFYEGELAFADGLPMTTKEDKGYHGFGMKSVKMIADKYGGEVSVRATDKIFYLTILFGRGR